MRGKIWTKCLFCEVDVRSMQGSRTNLGLSRKNNTGKVVIVKRLYLLKLNAPYFIRLALCLIM